MSDPLFELGAIMATPGAIDALADAKVAASTYLARHSHGDWGELCAEDTAENEQAVHDGLRILSAYTLPSGTKIWIITEADRSATTILLPEEY